MERGAGAIRELLSRLTLFHCVENFSAIGNYKTRSPHIGLRILSHHRYCLFDADGMVEIHHRIDAGYTSSKAALIGMTKALALEWGPKGVTVNAVSPTVVNTALGRRVFEGKRGEDFRAQLPTRRFAEPEEIALTILYLVSKGSGSTNGANVMVNGGYTIQ
ncbi:hypothetical protein CP335_08435 [Pseudomonas fluorescens]|uniref:3-oxoacyl-[acyl-carrier-protein] reductase n=2 Tax=Pseudomonas TaxID=286 RepID=A0A854XGI3_PSEFL|nr:hypothetical protein CP335_08435 [Pseudomonas fluorescens]